MIHRGRCNCLACFGFRLAAGMFLFGLAILALIGAILQAAEPKPLLVQDTAAAGTHAQWQNCIRISPGGDWEIV